MAAAPRLEGRPLETVAVVKPNGRLVTGSVKAADSADRRLTMHSAERLAPQFATALFSGSQPLRSTRDPRIENRD
jgi:hypothetical protein